MEKAIQIHSVRGRAIAAALAAWMAVMIAFGVVQTVRLDRANARLDAISRKAFYETCELTESMSVNLRKLLVAGEPGQIQLLLGQIAKQAQGASGNLALLPMGEDMIAGTLKFINQTGDFAEGLAVRVASGGAIGESDYQTIHELSENAAKFSVGMTQVVLASFLLAIRQRSAPECAHKISDVLGACLEHILSPCFGRIFGVIRPNPAVVGHFCNGAHQRNFNALKSHGLKACGLQLVGYRLERHILHAVPVHQLRIHRENACGFLRAAVSALPRGIQIPRHQPPVHFSQHTALSLQIQRHLIQHRNVAAVPVEHHEAAHTVRTIALRDLRQHLIQRSATS